MKALISAIKKSPNHKIKVESFDQEFNKWIKTTLYFDGEKFVAFEKETYWELEWNPTEKDLNDPNQFREKS